MKPLRNHAVKAAENCPGLLIHDYQEMAENCACSGLFRENTADLNQIDTAACETSDPFAGCPGER